MKRVLKTIGLITCLFGLFVCGMWMTVITLMGEPQSLKPIMVNSGWACTAGLTENCMQWTRTP